MDGRGGCCIARYGGGGAYDMSKVNRIMLKFRPIAPKPVVTGAGLSGSGGSSSENSEKNVMPVRGKRKYVKSKNTRRCNNTKKKKVVFSTETDPPSKTSSGGSVSRDELVTLPLLPETPERKESPARKYGGSPIWLSFEKQSVSEVQLPARDETWVVQAVTPAQPVKVVESYVTVECVTDTWVDGIGCTDAERMMKLERDACPGFVSDGENRVWWTNKAYREMMMTGGGDQEIMVWVVIRERVTVPVTCAAFTCRVRVTCGGKDEKRSLPLTVPCDVWRMENGGYAWSLDIKAALSLGR